MLLRVPLIAIGAFLGAALGMALSLVVGALVVVADLGLVRILTIASATAGGGAGIAAANTLATTFLRTRAGEQSPDRELPPARVVRPESELKRPL